MAEWLKALVLKTSDVERHRGFESLSLRQQNIIFGMEKYPRGRRGSPAKGVGCDKRRPGSNPGFSAKPPKRAVFYCPCRNARRFCARIKLPPSYISTWQAIYHVDCTPGNITAKSQHNKTGKSFTSFYSGAKLRTNRSPINCRHYLRLSPVPYATTRFRAASAVPAYNKAGVTPKYR